MYIYFFLFSICKNCFVKKTCALRANPNNNNKKKSQSNTNVEETFVEERTIVVDEGLNINTDQL